MIAIGSMFRDSHRYIDRSLHQFARLAKELDARGDECRFIWVENSSVDDTYAQLCRFEADTTIIRAEDDCPYFESVDSRERWRHLAWVANHVLDDVNAYDDTFIYVESDLAWDVETMLRLIDDLREVDVVSALNMRRVGDLYDRWGTRGLDGRRFTADPPHHPSLVGAEGLVEVQSAAGCTAMVGDVARLTRFSPDDCYVGWNRNMRLAGFKVWLDPQAQVWHD